MKNFNIELRISKLNSLKEGVSEKLAPLIGMYFVTRIVTNDAGEQIEEPKTLNYFRTLHEAEHFSKSYYDAIKKRIPSADISTLKEENLQ